jgi:D-3-phosphoglycerate dehydrogenase
MIPTCTPLKVLVADRLHEEAMEALRERFDVTAKEVSPEELLESIGEYDVLIVRSRTKVTAEVLERGERLRVVARAGVGVDNIDTETATRRRIMVVNAPAGSTQSVAELAVGLMLSLARRIPEANRSMKEGLWEKSKFRGVELSGKVLGLVGSGRIGSQVAHICQAFGMTVIAFDPYLPEEAARESGIQLTSLEDVLKRSDFLSIHAALTDETRHMISLPQLRTMKRTAYLINCARGEIVDEEALVEALREGLIAGAGLDVYEREPPEDSPLLSMENVVLTPHIGASTAEAQRRTGLLVVEQVVKAVAGQKPEFLVNREVLGL